MSNPTTHASQFDGSSPGWTLSGPERYDAGLWLEQATINLVTNPVAATGSSGWGTLANRTLTPVSSLPAPLPGYLSPITTGIRFDCSADVSGGNPTIGQYSITLPDGGQYPFGVWVYIPTSWAGGTVQLIAAMFAGGSPSPVAVSADMGIRDDWQYIAAIVGVDAGDVSGILLLRQLGGTIASGQQLWMTAFQAEQGLPRTSTTVGSIGSGYAFTGTAHASTSTRAASSAAISPTGILDPASGGIAFRITPTIETGLEEIWGECGVKGAGTDHLRWGRDASTHPFVEWSANNAAYQRLTGSETLSAGTAYDLYFGWNGTAIELAVDAGTLQTDTRDAVEGDFSTGDLTLEASAGGVIYQPFASFNRTLTAKEIATLNGKNNWTMKVLAGNPYINFQLRPY